MNFANLTQEERQSIMNAAKDKRETAIKQAIQNGAKVQHLTIGVSYNEVETIITMDSDGVIIDTTNKNIYQNV